MKEFLPIIYIRESEATLKKNSFMEGAIIATLAIIFSKILGVLYVIPFYKIIGEQGGALYGYAYNIYNIFLIISSAGIPLAISKITSEYETKKQYEEKNAMFIISKRIVYAFSILSFLICFLASPLIARLILGDLTGGNTIADVSFVIKCVSFALLVVPILSISRGYLQGHKFIAASSYSQVIEQIIRIAVILIGSYVAVKVLGIPLTYAVGISVLAAAIGAIIAFIYLQIKMKKSCQASNKDFDKVDKEKKKEIFKKIVGYSIPFIVINIANSLYNTTDMVLLIRALKNIGFSASDIETISSIFTTWGSKLVNIVKAFATGLTISLIPSLVASFVAKKKKEVNYYFNKSLQILLLVILPITIFMSIFAGEVWSLFYAENHFGPIIFKYIIMVSILDSAYVIICSALQGLYKTKLVYISVFLGLIINLILDIPLIYLFNNIGIYPYYGAITATVIGYAISLGIPLVALKKKEGFEYSATFKTMPKLVLSLIIMMTIAFLYRYFIPLNGGFILTCIYLFFAGILTMFPYLLINYKDLKELLLTKK